MFRSRAVGVSLVLAVLTLGAGTAAAKMRLHDQPGAAPPCSSDPEASYDTSVLSADGTPIAISVFRPAGACRERAAPVVLVSHGWGGHRWSVGDVAVDALGRRSVGTLLRNGYGVVSVDARGHGGSGGESSFQDPAVEVPDMAAVIDYAASLDWVLLDADGDPRTAIVGASYGGAVALLTAAFDGRVDALVPMLTWHDLPRAMAPNGVPKSDLFAALASRPGVRTSQPLVRSMLAAGRGLGLDPALVTAFERASPGRWIDRVQAPTFLLQGFRDAMFPVNEALETLGDLRRRGVDAWLVGAQIVHSDPDVLPSLDRVLPDTCGPWSGRQAIIEFLDATLRRRVRAQARMSATPAVTLATEQGACVVGSGPTAAGHLEMKVEPLTVGRAGVVAFAPATIAGVPRFVGTLAPAAEATIALVQEGRSGRRILGGLSTGARAGSDGLVSAELNAVATTLEDGDTLWLEVTGCACSPSGRLELYPVGA